jgi:hypothetical protein
MKLMKSKKGIALLAVLAVAVISAVGAYAYFSSTGSADGTGKVGTATGFTVVAGSESGNLFPLAYPNGAQALTGGSVTNAGSGYQNVHQIVATITAPTEAVTATGPNACSASDFALSSPGASWAITGASNGTATITPDANLAPAGVYNMTDLSVSMVDNGANQDRCQGATVNIHYAVS